MFKVVFRPGTAFAQPVKQSRSLALRGFAQSILTRWASHLRFLAMTSLNSAATKNTFSQAVAVQTEVTNGATRMGTDTSSMRVARWGGNCVVATQRQRPVEAQTRSIAVPQASRQNNIARQLAAEWSGPHHHFDLEAPCLERGLSNRLALRHRLKPEHNH